MHARLNAVRTEVNCELLPNVYERFSEFSNFQIK